MAINRKIRKLPDAEDPKYLKKLFDEHASFMPNQSNTESSKDMPKKGDTTAQKYMTRDDFVRALQQDSQLNSPLFELIFQVADQKSRGFISFTEFLLTHDLLKKPKAEYEVAFRLFDVSKNGKISLEDFVDTWKRYTPDGNHMIDLSQSELMRLYFGSSAGKLGFGSKSRKSIGFEEFSQLLKGLQRERVRQRFKYFDKEGRGFVSAEDFEEIFRSVAKHNLSPYLEQHLASIGNMDVQGGSEISWGSVIAFHNVTRNLDLVMYIAQEAAKASRDKSFDKSDFTKAMRRFSVYHGSIFTPLEVDIIFWFAGIIKNSAAVSRKKKSDADSNQPLSARRFNVEDLRLMMRPIHDDDINDAGINSSDQKISSEAESSPNEKSTEARWVTALRQIYNFTLGSIAGAIGATVVYPIDLVKTRMQNQRSAVVGELMYKNSMDCFKKVVKNEGFMGLYSGLGPQLVGVAPEKAIKLTVNDFVRSIMTDKDTGKIPLYAEILAGCTAGGSQVIFTNPLEIVKIRLQVQGEMGAVKKSGLQIVKELGLVGLYKGAAACLLRDIPFSGIYFTAYSHLKKDYYGESESKKLSMLELLSAGAIAGMPSAYLTTPADVIKTRLQVEARKGQATYKNIRHAFVTILKEEGPGALFKGGPARVFRSSPQFGVTLMSYELFKEWLPFPFESDGSWSKKSHKYGEKAIVGAPADSLEQMDRGAFKLRSTLQFLRDIDYRFGIYRVPGDH